MLKDLLEAPDLRAAARHNVPNFSEEFFLIASGLMEMVRLLHCHGLTAVLQSLRQPVREQARKERNSHVVQQLETVLRAAMEEKQKTLRPEIQLLNALLAQQDRRTRKRVRCVALRPCPVADQAYSGAVLLQMMQDPEALKVMAMNNGYFEGLVNRMLTGVCPGAVLMHSQRSGL